MQIYTDSGGRQYAVLENDLSESTLPQYSTKRLTVRVEIPPTLLQDALRTFYELVCRHENYLSEMKQVADYTPWRDAMIYALRDNGIDIDESDGTVQGMQVGVQ